MNKCYLDSNLLVYWKDDSSPYQSKATDKVAKLIKKRISLFISPLVLDEFQYVFIYGLRMKHVDDLFGSVKRAVSEILQIPLLSIINPPSDSKSQIRVVELMEKWNLRPRDAYHLLTMQANNIDSLATFDDNFKKVFAAKVVEKV